VKGDGQSYLKPFLTQLLYLRYQTSSRDNNTTSADPEILWRDKQSYRFQHGIVVGKRLTHAHEHYVSNVAIRIDWSIVYSTTPFSCNMSEVKNLINYLSLSKIALKALLAGGAEWTADRATYLR
jgi:hypothetical protein